MEEEARRVNLVIEPGEGIDCCNGGSREEFVRFGHLKWFWLFCVVNKKFAICVAKH